MDYEKINLEEEGVILPVEVKREVDLLQEIDQSDDIVFNEDNSEYSYESMVKGFALYYQDIFSQFLAGKYSFTSTDINLFNLYAGSLKGKCCTTAEPAPSTSLQNFIGIKKETVYSIYDFISSRHWRLEREEDGIASHFSCSDGKIFCRSYNPVGDSLLDHVFYNTPVITLGDNVAKNVDINSTIFINLFEPSGVFKPHKNGTFEIPIVYKCKTESINGSAKITLTDVFLRFCSHLKYKSAPKTSPYAKIECMVADFVAAHGRASICHSFSVSFEKPVYVNKVDPNNRKVTVELLKARSSTTISGKSSPAALIHSFLTSNGYLDITSFGNYFEEGMFKCGQSIFVKRDDIYTVRQPVVHKLAGLNVNGIKSTYVGVTAGRNLGAIFANDVYKSDLYDLRPRKIVVPSGDIDVHKMDITTFLDFKEDHLYILDTSVKSKIATNDMNIEFVERCFQATKNSKVVFKAHLDSTTEAQIVKWQTRISTSLNASFFFRVHSRGRGCEYYLIADRELAGAPLTFTITPLGGKSVVKKAKSSVLNPNAPVLFTSQLKESHFNDIGYIHYVKKLVEDVSYVNLIHEIGKTVKVTTNPIIQPNLYDEFADEELL